MYWWCGFSVLNLFFGNHVLISRGVCFESKVGFGKIFRFFRAQMSFFLNSFIFTPNLKPFLTFWEENLTFVLLSACSRHRWQMLKVNVIYFVLKTVCKFLYVNWIDLYIFPCKRVAICVKLKWFGSIFRPFTFKAFCSFGNCISASQVFGHFGRWAGSIFLTGQTHLKHVCCKNRQLLRISLASRF